MKKLFEINNIACQYPTNEYPVLFIDQLDIYRGEIVFIVGASGVGKSTILETLGLMNNTLVKGDQSMFSFHNMDSSIDLQSIWNKGDKAISSFRRDHYSFIFQSTNLFNNLSALDNACLSGLVQGKPYSQVVIEVKRIIKEMFDEKTALEIIQGKKVTELSGGQKQRLTFVRALAAGDRVLFADEPTGNLDWNNANILMQSLSRYVRSHGGTAIIVSHDMHLASEYGDRVIKINRRTKKLEESYRYFGTINTDSIYKRVGDSWLNGIQKHDNNSFAKFLMKTLVENE